jgi:hypothetical protein
MGCAQAVGRLMQAQKNELSAGCLIQKRTRKDSASEPTAEEYINQLPPEVVEEWGHANLLSDLVH